MSSDAIQTSQICTEYSIYFCKAIPFLTLLRQPHKVSVNPHVPPGLQALSSHSSQ